MPNTLSAYNPEFFANEALTAMEKALGLPGRVARGYDDSATARQYGDTITIRVPGVFTAQNAPSTAQDVTAFKTSLTLNIWKEVKFALPDNQLAYAGQRIIEEHIRPAAYALIDGIDAALAGLYVDVPWYADWSSPAVIGDVTNARKILFNNKVPMRDQNNLSFQVDGTIGKELLDISAFTQSQGSGQAGVDAQIDGFLGKRFGLNFFENQNTPTHTSATVADLAGAVNNGGGYAAGATTMLVNGFSNNAAFKKGDIVVVTGHTQQYVLTADATMDGTGAGSISFYGSPNVRGGGLEAAVVNTQVVTIVLSGGSGTTKTQTMAFHRNAFTLAWAKLPDFYDGQGIRVASVQDPVTGLALRARTWVDGNNSQFMVALDYLAGIKTLDGNKAVRVRD